VRRFLFFGGRTCSSLDEQSRLDLKRALIKGRENEQERPFIFLQEHRILVRLD
jgi:hypothetical protein